MFEQHSDLEAAMLVEILRGFIYILLLSFTCTVSLPQKNLLVANENCLTPVMLKLTGH